MMENDIAFLTNWVGSLPLSIISLVSIGFLSGIISSFLGIGGGFIFTPTFHGLLRLPAIDAIATSVAHIPPTMFSALLKYRENINYRFAGYLLVGAIPISQITAFFWGSFNDTKIGKTLVIKNLSANDLITIGLFVFILLLSFVFSFKNKNSKKKIYDEKTDIKENRLLLVITGGVTGLFSALLGIGGGFILVPVFIYLIRTSSLTATATSVFTILPITLLTAINYMVMGKVHLLLATLAAIGGISGAQVGSRLALKSKDHHHKTLLRLFHGVIIIFYLTLRFFI